jgi:hypothetical protein
MFKKVNTKFLFLVLVVLIAAIALVYLFDEKKGGRTIREELVRLDSGAVNKILLYPQSDNHAEIRFYKEGKTWRVEKEKFSAEADTNDIKNLINTFKLLKPQRLAASEKSRWKEFSTDDSLGTRIRFFSGETLLADLVVGKFSFNNMTRSGISYVRLYNEEGVYAVEGFIPMEVNQPFNQWRNQMLLRADKNNFTKLTFTYPADSGFVLQKENGKWKLDSAWADSAKTEQYLASLTYISSTSFKDNFQESSPLMTLVIEGNNMNPVTLRAFAADSIQKYIIHSSYNPQSYFISGTEKLSNKFFKSRSELMNVPLNEASVKQKKNR